MTPTYTRSADHNAVGRRLTEETDKNGAPYYQKANEAKKRMEPKTLKQFIEEEIETPILTENTANPRQLVLALNGKIVVAYDLVSKLSVDSEDNIAITGWLDNVYTHKRNEFDSILIYRYMPDSAHEEKDVLQGLSLKNV
jgi:hypothetical protein